MYKHTLTQIYYNELFKNCSNDDLIDMFNKYKSKSNYDPTGCCLLVGEITSRNIKI